MWRLPHKEEQLSSALSMVPGILLALYWSRRYRGTPIYNMAYTYILTCLGSIVYHVHSAYHVGYHPRWLRFDIFCQQLSGLCCTYYTIGARGILVILPLLVVITLLDFSHVPSSYAALAAHALSVFTVSLIGSVRGALQWLIAFFTYGMKDVFPNGYTIIQNLWHVLCHMNMAKSWADAKVILKL